MMTGEAAEAGVTRGYVCPARDQLFLMPVSMRDWLDEGHLAWFVLDVVAELYTGALHRRRGGCSGRPPYEPEMMWWIQLVVATPDVGSCYGEEKPGVESCRGSRNALGWASACGATGASGPVLGGDRSRCIKREGCGRGGCVAEHWCPVVPQRDAASRSCAGVWPLSVLLRAGGDCGPARRRCRGASDRASARSCAVDDLPGVATQCCDRTWPR
jgi:hypothetical protein